MVQTMQPALQHAMNGQSPNCGVDCHPCRCGMDEEDELKVSDLQGVADLASGRRRCHNTVCTLPVKRKLWSIQDVP